MVTYYNERPLVFKTMRFKFNYIPGSKSSISLLDSLRNLENIDTFRSPAVQALLNYKWNLVKV